MDEKLTPQKSLEHIKQIIDSLDIKIDNTSLIQDNKIIFKFEDRLYRCRMPNQRERSQAEEQQEKCKTRLYKEGGYQNRNTLKKTLKDSGTVDIDVLEAEKLSLAQQLKDTWLDIAPLGDDQQEQINKLTLKFKELEDKHYNICIEISNYLSPCIEDRAEKVFVEYLTFSCTQGLKSGEGDEWVSIWKSFSDFEKDDTYLPNKAVMILTHLILHTRE